MNLPTFARRTLSTGFATICLLMTVPAILPAVAQDEEESDVLEEITVTARKRSVDIQKAPIAVSSVGADVMEQSAVVKLDDFNTYVPGLTIAKNDGAGRVVAIRGVGWETAQNLGTQPGVLVYIDGVYLANPLAMGLDLGEIERVEVLRGPQGTEFGQSATGGAVNIITKKARPGEQGGSLDVQAGTYSYYKGRASLQVAPGERSGLHVSVQKGVRDGFAEIKGGALDGYELDDYDATTAHLSFTWTPKSNVGVTLSGFWQDSDQNGAAQRHLDDPNPDPRELTQDYPSTFALTNTSLSAIIDWRLPSGLTFKSLTGWQKLEKDQTVDGDRLTTDLVSVNLTGFFANNFDILPYWINDSDAFSQEFNLTSRTDKLDWVVGLYYLDHENFNDFLEAVAPGTPEDYADQLANPGPDTLPPFQPPLEFVETRKLTREDSAVYGQMTYRISDRTALTLGGRYQRDESTDDSTQFWFTESLQVLEDEAFTWKLGLDFDVNDTQLVYALLSTGWKNGGNNPGALSGALDTPPQFEPEEVTALEIGVKNTLAGDRARFNVTGFYYDYENYQFVQEDPVPFAGGAGNIPSLTIFGVEGEWNWLIDERWRLDGFFSLSDGEVDSDLAVLDTVDFLNSGFGRFTETGVADRASLRVNLRGNVPPKLVEESGRIALSYNRPFGGNSLFIGRVDVQHRGEFQYRVFNHPDVDTVPDYTIANLYFEADFGNMPLEVSLSVTNLTDEDGVNSRFSNPYGLHTTSDELIPPRQVIARFRYSF